MLAATRKITLRLLAAAVLVATFAVATPAASVRASSGPVVLVRHPHRLVVAVAVSRGYLVWETALGEEDQEHAPKDEHRHEGSGATLLMQRDLHTNRQRILARGLYPFYGLASTSGWVVYPSGTGSTLIAVRHDGTKRHVLSRQLVTPIASRGELVAWAEQDRQRQRVVVQNMATGKRWVAAVLRPCIGSRCYRIDGVTLAERGVVFARGAVGSQPSFVVRRAFEASRTTSVALPGDPQPDLAPSSAGALYYFFGRGWYRWDFGSSHPRATRFRGQEQAPVLGYERGNLFVRNFDSCRTTLSLQRSDGTTSVLLATDRLFRLARLSKPGCAELVGLTYSGDRATSAWALHPIGPDGTPEEETLAGLVVAQPF